MRIEGVDAKTCIGCGACVEVCPTARFEMVQRNNEDERTVARFDDPVGACIECGHCIAMCPTSAVVYHHAEEPLEDPRIGAPEAIVDFETVMVQLRARRSHRHFRSEIVPRGSIEKVLEAMRYAPSASNAETWEFVVLTESALVRAFSTQVLDFMRRLHKLVQKRWLIKLFTRGALCEKLLHPRTENGLARMLERGEAGEDPIFFDAPCVIVLHAPDYGSFAGNNAGLAFLHGMLAAEALGLGTCWIGYAQEALRRRKTLREWLGVPKGHNVWGVMVLGYPTVRYERAPPRKPIRATWNEVHS